MAGTVPLDYGCFEGASKSLKKTLEKNLTCSISTLPAMSNTLTEFWLGLYKTNWFDKLKS